jgi:hypothetical protein
MGEDGIQISRTLALTPSEDRKSAWPCEDGATLAARDRWYDKGYNRDV